MPLRSKNKAGYIGYDRVNSPDVGSGIWNLNQHHTEVTDYSWSQQSLYTNYDGNLNGFTVSGATTSSNAIYVPGNSYAYRDMISPFTSILFKTMTFEVYISGGVCGVIVGSTAGGRGPLLKLDARGGSNYSGMMFQTSWTVRGDPPITGVQLPANSWVPVRLEVNNAMRIDWSANNKFDRQPILLSGPFITFFGLGGGGYFRNIRVYNGVT
jgi:hypothetical protein